MRYILFWGSLYKTEKSIRINLKQCREMCLKQSNIWTNQKDVTTKYDIYEQTMIMSTCVLTH